MFFLFRCHLETSVPSFSNFGTPLLLLEISGPHFCCPEALGENILVLRHVFSPRMPLESSAASFSHFGTPFSHPGSTLGNDFGISGAPWGAIWALREHLGRPFWHLGTTLEDHSSRMDTKLQITGFLSIWNDFWTCLCRFSGPKCCKNRFLFRLVSMLFF